MPVTAIARERGLLPYRPPTKSAVVTKPWRCETDQSRLIRMKTMGYSTTVYGTAKKPLTAPVAHIAAGTATNVYAVYRSPPSRNQVTQEPNFRPPRPHSSSECRPSLPPPRHRAA